MTRRSSIACRLFVTSSVLVCAQTAHADPVAAAPPVTSKWSASLYGFAELDAIRDSTQGLGEIPGNTMVAATGTYGADHSRVTFSVRNSRVGLKVGAPEVMGFTASGLVEMDFFGPPSSTATEQQTFTSPIPRLRHAALKLENPYVDVLFGQSWQLFGFQTSYFPNTVQIQGIPGQAFGRNPQLRLSHVFKSSPANVEVAVAALRPMQRDSGDVDGQAGVRAVLNQWRGVRTVNATSTVVDGLSVGVSGAVRGFVVPQYGTTPAKGSSRATGYGASLDAFVPVIPATENTKGNSLSLTGSYVRGTGISDLFVGLTAGVKLPETLPATTPGAAPVPYVAGVDNGPVAFDAQGNLTTINWQSVVVGAQYYLPPAGKVWVAGNYSYIMSSNIDAFAPKGLKRGHFADALVMADVTPQVRLGVEYAWTHQFFVNQTEGTNHRGQVSAFYVF